VVPKAPLERDIQSSICDYVAYRKYFFWRQNTGGMYRDGHYFTLPKYAMRGAPHPRLAMARVEFGVEAVRGCCCSPSWFAKLITQSASSRLDQRHGHLNLSRIRHAEAFCLANAVQVSRYRTFSRLPGQYLQDH